MFRPRFNKNKILELLKFGMKGQFANIFNVMNYKLDIFIVAYFLSTDRLGIYAIAVSLTNILNFIPLSLINVLMPKAANDMQIKKYLPQVIRIVVFIMITISITLIFFGKMIITYLYSTTFLDAYILLIILLPGSIFLGINHMITSSLTGKGIPSVQSISAGIGVIITVLLDFILIPKIGILGASIATSTSYISMAVVSIFFLNKYEHIHIHKIFIIEKQDFIKIGEICKQILSKSKILKGLMKI